MNPVRFNYQIAQTILNQAYNDTKEIPSYRLGQAIFNRLPCEICDKIRGTEYDMFYMKSDSRAAELLFQLVCLNEESFITIPEEALRSSADFYNWINEDKDHDI